eukprot:scaffold1319_cov126-Cylindrotheca_fusiformis.AAC.55
MLIRGDEMDEAQTLAAFWEAKQDDDCHDLELRGVELEYDLTYLLIDVIKAKKWQTIRISFCQGLVNDVVTACMSNEVRSFSLQSAVNVNTMNSIAYGLNYSKSLVSLHITVDINSSQIGIFARALARNVCLENLDFSGSTIDSQCIGHLGFALRINRTIKSISFDGCYLEDSQLCSLLLALQDHPRLKSISLQRNSCHDQSMPAGTSWFQLSTRVERIVPNTKLIFIFPQYCLLHYNDLEHLDMSYLVRKKKSETPVVEEEPVVQNEPETHETTEDKSEQEEVVADDNPNPSNVDEADTDEAKIDEKDSKPEKQEETPEHKVESEPEPEHRIHNNSLKTLQLAGNGLNDSFVDSTLRIFGQNSSLEELNLFGNRVTDRGVLGIVQKLRELRHLRSLWLGHNVFTAVGARAILEAMRTNFAVEELNVSSLQSDDTMQKIQDEIDYYGRLNRDGRRIFASDVSEVPMSLWSLILERANRIHAVGSSTDEQENRSQAADAIFCLLHGPALLDNHALL